MDFFLLATDCRQSINFERFSNSSFIDNGLHFLLNIRWVYSDFLSPLPKEVDDIIPVYGLENKISDPTRFGHNSSSLLDPILVIDSTTVLEANTIPVDRNITDHDPTYIVVDCGYKNLKSYTRTIWLYNQGNYPLFRDLISKTDWESIISEQPTVDIACKLFTGKLNYSLVS